MAVSLSDERAAGAPDMTLVGAVLAGSDEAVAVLAADGRLLCRNAAHERLFGGGIRDWNDIRDRYSPAAQAVLDTDVAQALRRGEQWEGVLQARGEGGRVVPVHHRAGLVRGVGGDLLTVHVRDLSAQKSLEETALRAEEAARRANQAKTRFLAAASHDIRQPLQALAMFVEVLAAREHPPAEERIIERIRESVTATDALLTTLLEISKLEAGVVEPRLAEVPVAQVLHRLESEFAGSAAGLKFRVLSSDAVVRTDQALLERMLRHLVGNALRYTARGGVLIGCRRRAGALRIEVWDTGSGIPADQTEAIFREFHQLGNVQRDRRQGLGLGLAIVDRLSRLLGHTVSVRSTLHRGSVFAVELPLAETTPRPAPEQLGLAMGRAPGLIAVLDDEPAVLESLRLLLESWGHRVVAAEDAEALIARLTGARAVPDLMIADHRLRNGTTGGQAIKRVRDLCKSEMPAIVLTGDTAPERLRMATKGGHALLHKPVQAAALKAAIDRVMAEPARRRVPLSGH